MNKKCFESRPHILDREFNIDIEDDYDYYQPYDENLPIRTTAKEFHTKDSYLYTCENENCINISNEINKLSEECLNLEHKCILLDHYQSKSLLEMTEKISE